MLASGWACVCSFILRLARPRPVMYNGRAKGTEAVSFKRVCDQSGLSLAKTLPVLQTSQVSNKLSVVSCPSSVVFSTPVAYFIFSLQFSSVAQRTTDHGRRTAFPPMKTYRNFINGQWRE